MSPILTLSTLGRSLLLSFAILALGSGGILVAEPATAKGSKSVAISAKWIGFDADQNTVKVKVTSKGKGNRGLVKKYKKETKKGKEVTFNVIPTGSILKRTSVAINGMKGEITEIAKDKQVVVYWVEDPNKDGELFARKIDVVLSEEEWEARTQKVE